ncbi:MAG: sulfatase-like hydrolase/transferase [Saprospiraceae bacterium]|nr:sulfatase-like hydrolase/transferase [Saprospiraceae bacterium]
MSDHNSILLLLILLSIGCNTKDHNAPHARPNIILIMADDLGYGGLSCYGNTVLQTPHIDSLSAHGLRFTDFHSNGSVCSPTRAALLTGKYQQRVGMEGVIYVRGPTRQVGLNPDETTIADVLKNTGYATGIMGKWHLGYDTAFNPLNFGFDEFRGYLSGNIDFHSHYDNAGIYDWWHNRDTVVEPGYVTDLITKHSIEFISKHRSEPFFLYIPHEAPHVPFQGRTDTAYRYPNREFTYHGPVVDKDRAYIDMVEAMDDGVGAIMQHLRRLQLEEHTLVIFISDNGAEPFGHNGPLNGAKISLFEGGHRVPAIAYWKGQIDPQVTDATAMTMDWMPTFLRLAQVPDMTDLMLDGTDLKEILLRQSSLPSRHLYWRYRKQKVCRKDQFKLLITDQDTLLFDLQSDLAEQNNAAVDHPEKVRDLSLALNEWEQSFSKIEQKTR